jgi:hypothetical protein
MIKRLLTLIAAVALVATSAIAQTTDRDMLLTTDGTLYTIDSVPPDASAHAGNDCLRTLILTTQQGTELKRTVVPYAVSNGVHWRPALAYDADSKTVFLFWTHSPNAMSSELLFCTVSPDGKFSDLTTFEARAYRLRFNLSIAVTRKVWTPQPDNSSAQEPGISAHAVWWEETGDGEQARYALLTVDGGKVTDIETRDLATFIDPATDTSTDASPDVDPEIFRHPSIFEAPSHDSVDVIFGDVTRSHFNRINLRPVANGRLHVPTGRVTGGYSGPPSFAVAPEADRPALSIHSLWDRDTNNLLFYYYADNTVHYLMNRAGAWSSMRSVALKNGLSVEAAPDVLRRMMAAQ